MSIVTYLLYQNLVKAWIENGGETGIRTPEPVAWLLPFQGSAIDHSAISPNINLSYFTITEYLNIYRY